MEIAKFRLQLSTALEWVTIHFWQVHCKLRKLTRIVAERAGRFGHELRLRENALRALLAAKSREAIVAANSKVSKAKARLSIALEKGTGHLREAQNRLARVKRSIAEKLQKVAEERRARKDEMRVLEARSREAIVEAERQSSKVKAQRLNASEQWTAHLRQMQNPLAGLTRSMAERPQQLPTERRARKDELGAAEAMPREAIAEADSKITEVKAQPTIASEQRTTNLRQVQNLLGGLTRSIAEKPQPPSEELRAPENELRVLEARPREAIVAERSKMAKAKAQLSNALEQGNAHLRQVQTTLSELVRNVVHKRQRRRQELGARESQMRELLANSPDAIAVIKDDHCFVTANRRALDLFGVSETNLSKFNIDVFLFRSQIQDLHQNGSFFMGRQERHGKCVIRRLDGSLRVAEFAFVPDFLPLQHLCRFYDLCMPRPTPMRRRVRPATEHYSNDERREKKATATHSKPSC